MKSAPWVVLLWKEYRTQRGFWLAVKVIGFVIQILVALLTDKDHKISVMTFGLAGAFPVFYAVGCSCLLFGGEKEEGTWPFLKAIAARPAPVIASKVSFFLLSTFSMLAVLSLVDHLVILASWGDVGPEVIDPALQESSMRLLPYFAWLTVHFLVFGIFYGLVTRKVITAVIATAVTSVLCMVVFTQTPPPIGPTGSVINWPMVWIVIILGSVFLCNIWLIRRQLTGPRDRSKSNRAANADGAELMRYSASMPLSKKQIFRRLLWQEMRQSRSFVLLYLAACALPIFGTLLGETHLLALFAVGILPAVFGLMAFRSEQQDQRFRFWSERGFSPAAIWFSRHCFWLSLAMVLTIGFGVLMLFMFLKVVPHPTLRVSGPREFYRFVDNYNSYFADPYDSLLVGGVLGFFAAYGIGQLMSMLIPRSLIAGFYTFMLLSIASYWHLVTSSLGIPLWMSLGWIFPVTMGATLLRMTDLGLDRRTWRARGKVLATLGLPFLLVIGGTAVYRVVEIPDRDAEYQELMADQSRPVSDEALETAAMYRAIQLGPPLHANQNWYQDNRSQVPRLIAITERASCALWQTTDQDGNPYEETQEFGKHLFRLLLFDAGQLKMAGKRDEEFSRHLAMLRMANHFAQGGGISRWQASQQQVLETYEKIAW